MKDSLWNEVQEFFTKNGALLMSLGIGIAGKLALDAKNGKKLTFNQLIITVILSCLIGYCSAVFMERMGLERWVKVVCPIATLLGESITMWLVANCGKYMTIFADWIVRDKRK